MPRTRKAPLETIINQIDEFRSFFVKERSMFPYVSESAIGLLSFNPPAYYQKEGINFEIKLDRPIDNDLRDEINTVGHFINQNFLLRLYALMNYYEFIGSKISLDKESPGYKEVEILRRLRNIFAHSTGKYNPSEKDHRRLKKELIETFDLKINVIENFPLNIDEVIDRIIDGCKKYIQSNYNNIC